MLVKILYIERYNIEIKNKYTTFGNSPKQAVYQAYFILYVAQNLNVLCNSVHFTTIEFECFLNYTF